MRKGITTQPQKAPTSKTQISFDLADVLKPDEIEKFTASAEEAGVSTTEHFINLTLSEKKAG